MHRNWKPCNQAQHDAGQAPPAEMTEPYRDRGCNLDQWLRMSLPTRHGTQAESAETVRVQDAC